MDDAREHTDHTEAGRQLSIRLIVLGLALSAVSAVLQRVSVDQRMFDPASDWVWGLIQILVTVAGAAMGAGFIGLVLVALGLGRR